MLIPSLAQVYDPDAASLSRRVNANSQLRPRRYLGRDKLIKKGEC